MLDKKWHGNVSEVYYCLYLSRQLEDKITIICVQDFDIYDYSETKFVKNSKGETHCFDDENNAITFLNKHYKQVDIDPEYYRGAENFKLIVDDEDE